MYVTLFVGHPDPYDSTAEKVSLGYGAGGSYDGSEETRTEFEIVCKRGLYKGNYVSLLNKHTWNKRHHCEIHLIHSKGYDFLVKKKTRVGVGVHRPHSGLDWDKETVV